MHKGKKTKDSFDPKKNMGLSFKMTTLYKKIHVKVLASFSNNLNEEKTYREIAIILRETVTAVWRRLNQLRYEAQKEKYYKEIDRERKKKKYYNLKKELKK